MKKLMASALALTMMTTCFVTTAMADEKEDTQKMENIVVAYEVGENGSYKEVDFSKVKSMNMVKLQDLTESQDSVAVIAAECKDAEYAAFDESEIYMLNEKGEYEKIDKAKLDEMEMIKVVKVEDGKIYVEKIEEGTPIEATETVVAKIIDENTVEITK